MGTVLPFGQKPKKRRGRSKVAGRKMNNAGALKYLRDLQATRGGAATSVASVAELATMFAWNYPRTHKAVGRWAKNGQAQVENLAEGRLSILVHPDRGALERGNGKGVSKAKGPRQKHRKNPGILPSTNAPDDTSTTSTNVDPHEAADTWTEPENSRSGSKTYFFSRNGRGT